MINPPDPLTLPTITCPSCGHNINAHGIDPGGTCGIGGPHATDLCPCLWSPNDIAIITIAAISYNEGPRP